MKGVTFLQWYSFVERTKNFRIDVTDKHLEENLDLFMALHPFKEELIAGLDSSREQNGTGTLNYVFSQVFRFMEEYYDVFTEYSIDQSMHRHIYDACLFTTIASFLHSTKRIKGKRLAEFVYDHSTYSYKSPDSPNFTPLEQASDTLNNEVSTLRKSRHRILSDRPTYFKKNEWSAMPIDSEHEWSLYFLWNQKIGEL